MDSTDKANAYAEQVVLLVKAALAPIQERLAAAEARAARADALEQAFAAMRDRIVTLETKAGSMPSTDMTDIRERVTPLADRLTAMETKSVRADALDQAVTDIRERVVALEVKAAALQIPDLTEVRDRLVKLETAPTLEDRVKALETKPTTTLEVRDDGGVRDRVLVLETQSTSTKDRIGELDASIKELQTLREKLLERIVTVETRAVVPGPAGPAGKDGVNGKDGVDGLGFDDVTAEFDGDRTVLVKFVRGLQVKSFPIVLPFQRYQGVFIEGKAYQPGDVVTWGGSMWHCNADTSAKPGDGAKEWQLCVKRGRDGNDGRHGRDAGLPVMSVRP